MDTLPPHATNDNLMFPNASGIYQITCTVNNKIYIGSATNLRTRKKHHIYYLRHNTHHNPHLQNAWNKYGEEAFTFDVLELILLPEMLTTREQYYLDKLKPFGSKGYNMSRDASSRLGIKHTPETRAKMGLSKIGKKHTPEARAKMGLPHIGNKYNLGRERSPETREKLRQANLGKPSPMKGKTTSPETREKLRQANLGKTYPPRPVKPNTYRVDGDVSYISLTQGKEAIISTSDLDRALKVRWRAQHDSRTGNYRANGMFQGEIVSLNRYLMEAKEGEWVDNLNGDTLDNRRSNLRLRDTPDYEQVSSTSKTGIRGVSLYRNNSNEMRYKFSCQCTACKITKLFPYTEEGLEAARIFAEAHYAAMNNTK